MNHVRGKVNTFLNICHHRNEIVVERLGKFSHVEKPGLFIAIPFIDRLANVCLAEASVPVTPQSGVTRDNVSVKLTGQVFFQFEDAYKAVYGSDDPVKNVLAHAQSSMRSAVGSMSLDEIFHNRSKLNEIVLTTVSQASSNWGVKVLRYEILDVLPDRKILEAMDLESSAERARRAQVKKAEGDKQETILKSEAVKLQAENEAFAAVVQAKAKADALLLDAQAKADALVLDSKAKAEAENLNYDAQCKGIKSLLSSGLDAQNIPDIMFAQKRIDAFGKIVGTNSSIVIPENISGVASLANIFRK